MIKQEGNKMTETKKRGRWKAGESGNPAGRKPGTGEVAALRASIAGHVPEIIGRLVEAAKAGDVQAARLLLERVLPPIKPAELAAPLALPDGTLAEQGRAVLAAVAAGELAPGAGAQLLAAIAEVGKVEKAEASEAEWSSFKL